MVAGHYGKALSASNGKVRNDPINTMFDNKKSHYRMAWPNDDERFFRAAVLDQRGLDRSNNGTAQGQWRRTLRMDYSSDLSFACGIQMVIQVKRHCLTN